MYYLSFLFFALLTSHLAGFFPATPVGPHNQQTGFGDVVTLDLSVSNNGATAEEINVYFQDSIGPTLEDARSVFHGAADDILAILPGRYFFSDGESGTSISDGGGDMYDGGNSLYFGSSNPQALPYSNNTVTTDPNSGVEYFTLKLDGLFFLAADYGDLDTFKIDGGLGADGSGSVVLEEFDAGFGYQAYYKSVVNSGDPSVNHLILAPNNNSLTRIAEESTDSDGHTVSGLSSGGRLYYLLFADQGGQRFSNATLEQLAETVLGQLNPGPSWVKYPRDLPIGPGSTVPFQITLDSFGLAPGDHSTRFAFAPSNLDPAELPIGLYSDLTLTVAEPTFTVSSSKISVGALVGSPIDPISIDLLPGTGFTSFDDLEITTEHSWLNVSKVPGNNSILLSPTSVGGSKAQITLTLDGTQQIIDLEFLLAPLNLSFLLPDPLRPRLYAINKSGKGQGSVLVIDTITKAVLRNLPVGTEPSDLALTEDSAELLVMNTSDPSIHRIDLETLETTDIYHLAEFSDRNDDVGGHVVDGPGSIIYYIDEQWGPRLRVFDTATGTVLQTFSSTSANPDDTSNNSGFGDIIVNREQTKLFGWQQYGDGAGSANTAIVRFTIAADGTLSDHAAGFNQYTTNFRRDPFDSPLLLTRNNDRLFIKDGLIDMETLQITQRFPDEVYSITPNGKVVAGTSTFYPEFGGGELLPLPGSFPVQACLPDYSHFVYVEQGELQWLDLIDELGLDALGISITPPPNSTVTSPESFVWLPVSGISTYDFYLGTDEASVTSATTSSPEFRGRILGEEYQNPGPLAPGTYYWKASPQGSNVGPVYSFTVSDIQLSQSEIKHRTLTGIQGLAGSIEITSVSPGTNWTASSPDGWVELQSTSGTTPSTLEYSINTTSLPPGRHESTILISFDGTVLSIPVTVTADQAHFIQAKGDRELPFVYLVSQVENDGISPAYLVELDTRTDTLTRAVPCGKSVTDLAIHYQENRIYIPNRLTGVLRAFDRSTLEQIQTYQFSPQGAVGYASGDISGVSAGSFGQIIVNEWDQHTNVSLIDTSDGTVKATTRSYSDGRGVHSPDGGYYYHPLIGTTRAALHKYEVSEDALTEVAVFNERRYSSPAVISGDGSRIFWGREVLNTDLESLATLENTIIETSFYGDLAFTSGKIFNTRNGHELATLPISTSIQAISQDQTKLFLIENDTITTVDLTSIVTLPPVEIRPSIADNSAVIGTDQEISWSTIPSAISYDIYLGTDRNLVTDAESFDAEFLTNSQSNVLPGGFSGLSLGQTYYWKIVPIGLAGPGEGSVFSFRVSPTNVTPREIRLTYPEQSPIPIMTLALEGTSPWTASEDSSWIAIDKTSGNAVDQLFVAFDSSGLTPGEQHETSITLVSEGVSVEIPVYLDLRPLNFTHAEGDVLSPFVYAISQDDGEEAPSFLIRIDSLTDRITNAVPCGRDVSDFTIHYKENRLYLTNYEDLLIRAFDRSSLEQVRVYDELLIPTNNDPDTFQSYPLDPYKISSGRAGEIMIEGEDQWVSVSLIDTSTSKQLGRLGEREGDGQFSPDGLTYYHGDSNSSGAVLTSHDVLSNLEVVKTTRDEDFNYYGSRNLQVSGDGTLITWGGSVFSAEQDFLFNLAGSSSFNNGNDVRAISYFGDIITYNDKLVDVAQVAAIATLPVSTTVQAIPASQDKIYLFLGNDITVFDLGALTDLPTLQLTPNIADGTVVFGTDQALSWSPIPSANTYHVYFGTDEAAVTNASPTSPEYLGSSTSTFVENGVSDLEPGQTYFWRISYEGPTGSTAGKTSSFRVAPIEISPGLIQLEIPQGAPASEQTLSLSTPIPVTWSASGSPGVTLSETEGTTNGTLSVELETAGLPPGTHQKTISFTVGSETVDYGITINVFENRLVRLQKGLDDETVLALTSQPPSQGPSFLMEVNASTGTINRFVDAGDAPVDFALAPATGKIHLLSPGGKPSAVIDSSNWNQLDPLNLPPLGVSILARNNGQLVVGEGEGGYHIHLVHPETSEVLFSAITTSVNSPQRRPMALDPDSEILYTLNNRGYLAAFEIAEDRFLQTIERPSSDFSADFNGNLLITESGTSLFYQDYRITSGMQNRLKFNESFQPLAIDPQGLIAIGESRIVYARSGAEIATFGYTSPMAAISSNSQFLIRFNPVTGLFDSTPISSFLTLPGHSPQPGEEVIGAVTEISVPPVEGATFYQLFIGHTEDSLAFNQMSFGPNFVPGADFPSIGNVYWRVDALGVGPRVRGAVHRFSILPVTESTTLSRRPHSLHIADGVLTVSSSESYASGLVWTNPVADPLPESLQLAATLTQESNNRPYSATGHGYAGGRIFANQNNTLAGYEKNRFGGYLGVVSQSLGETSSRSMKSFTTSGDLLFAGIERTSVNGRPVEVEIYRTFPDLVLEQTVRLPGIDSSIQGFGDQIVAAGDLMVVSNVLSSSNTLTLWIYRRNGTGTTPWRLQQRVNIADYRYATANLDTDGERIAISYQRNSDRMSQVTVLSEDDQSPPSARWTSSIWTTSVDNLIEGATSSNVLGKIAIDQNLLAVTSPSSQVRFNHLSAVLVLQLIEDEWVQQSPISASTTRAFGSDLEISDGKLFVTDSDSQLYRFDLAPDANRHPLFASPAPFQSVAGRPYEAHIEINDDSLSYTVEVVQKPSWMELESTEGEYRLVGTAPASSSGNSPVRIRVTDSEGLSTYRTFTLEQLRATDLPTLVNGGGAETLGVGQEFALRPETGGIGPFTWQWYLNGEPIDGASGPTFSLNQVSLQDSGTYEVVVTNAVGSVTGEAFDLIVNPANRFAGDWPTFGGSANHLGRNPATLGTHHFLPAWSTEVYTSNYLNRAAIADGTVFVTPTSARTEAFATALSLETGEIIWKHQFEEGNSLNPPSYHEGRIYLQRGNHSSDTQLWALDAASGTSIWSAPFGAQWESYEAPAVTADAIYINGGGYGGFYGFNHQGEELFFQRATQYDDWTPTVNLDRLYTWVAGHFAEQDPLSGEDLWSVTTDWDWSGWSMNTISAVTGNEALLASTTHLICVDLESRRIRWERTPAGAEVNTRPTGSPAVAADRVFLISGDTLRSYDLQNGEILDTYQAESNIISRQPLLTNDHLFFSTETETSIIELESGQLVQTLPVGGLLSYSNGYLTIASGGTLHAYFANDIPDINTATLPDMVEDVPYSLQLDLAHDDAGEDLTLEMINAPSFLSMSDSGEITGIFESDEEFTTYLIEIRASDGVNPTVVRELPLNLVNVNDSPVVSVGPANLEEDAPTYGIIFSEIASDEESPFNELTFEASVDNDTLLPADSLWIEGGALRFTLAPDQSGDAIITLKTSDPDGATTTSLIPLTVTPVADPPRLADSVMTEVTANDAADDQSIDFSTFVYDPDEGDAITYSITGNTNPAIFSSIEISGSSGILEIGFAPYLSGTSTITITMTDLTGLEISTELTVTLPEIPPAGIAPDENITLNRRTGLYEQKITITNSSGRAIGGFDLVISNLQIGYTLYGITGDTINHRQPIAAGESVVLTLEYHSPTSRELPTPAFELVNTLPENGLIVVPGNIDPDRISAMPDGSMLLEFASNPGKRYRVQFTNDMVTWHNSPTIIDAAANRIQWLDQGLPKTNCHPKDCRMRAYRILDVTTAAASE